jgi:hypothetical protein
MISFAMESRYVAQAVLKLLGSRDPQPPTSASLIAGTTGMLIDKSIQPSTGSLIYHFKKQNKSAKVILIIYFI